MVQVGSYMVQLCVCWCNVYGSVVVQLRSMLVQWYQSGVVMIV